MKKCILCNYCFAEESLYEVLFKFTVYPLYLNFGSFAEGICPSCVTE